MSQIHHGNPHFVTRLYSGRRWGRLFCLPCLQPASDRSCTRCSRWPFHQINPHRAGWSGNNKIVLGGRMSWEKAVNKSEGDTVQEWRSLEQTPAIRTILSRLSRPREHDVNTLVTQMMAIGTAKPNRWWPRVSFRPHARQHIAYR